MRRYAICLSQLISENALAALEVALSVADHDLEDLDNKTLTDREASDVMFYTTPMSLILETVVINHEVVDVDTIDIADENCHYDIDDVDGCYFQLEHDEEPVIEQPIVENEDQVEDLTVEADRALVHKLLAENHTKSDCLEHRDYKTSAKTHGRRNLRVERRRPARKRRMIA